MEETIYPSEGGRLTLIKSTLSSFPFFFFFSCLYSTSQERSRFEKIQRDFLWGASALEKKPHLVNWNLAQLSKEGGLGIHNLVVLNKALLGKWSWRFAIEGEC